MRSVFSGEKKLSIAALSSAVANGNAALRKRLLRGFGGDAQGMIVNVSL
jgi:hypothetical protein